MKREKQNKYEEKLEMWAIENALVKFFLKVKEAQATQGRFLSGCAAYRFGSKPAISWQNLNTALLRREGQLCATTTRRLLFEMYRQKVHKRTNAHISYTFVISV